MIDHKTHHVPNIKLYLSVFAALMALTIVTVAVSYIHLSKAQGIALGLAIATFKASLVAAFFMHLKGERALIYWLLALTFLLAFGLVFIGMDTELTRDVRTPISVEASVEAHGH